MARVRGAIVTGLTMLGVALALGACESVPADTPHPDLAFVLSSCGGCHAVGRLGESPNPAAPPFAAVVNQQGLSGETLGDWLRNAHNYPDEMQFRLGDAEIDRLVAYMLTLRDPNYRPAI